MKFNVKNDIMARVKMSEYEKLCKQLGELDKERRKVLHNLKGTPEFVMQYLKDNLTGFIAKGNWYARKTVKGDEYYKLVEYVPKGNPATTAHKSVLVTVDLKWNHFPIGATKSITITETITLSLFNDNLEKQILAERVLATKFSEKDASKIQLNARKLELEEELKKVNSELVALK